MLPSPAVRQLRDRADTNVGVLLAALVGGPLGNQRLNDDAGVLGVVAPGRDLGYYLDLATGQIRRYGCSEPHRRRAV